MPNATKPKELLFKLQPHEVSSIVSALLHRAEVLDQMTHITPSSPERESYEALEAIYRSLANSFIFHLNRMDTGHLSPRTLKKQ